MPAGRAVQLAAMVGAVVLLAVAAALGVYSFVQTRRQRLHATKLSAGEEFSDEIGLISSVGSRRSAAEPSVPNQ